MYVCTRGTQGGDWREPTGHAGNMGGRQMSPARASTVGDAPRANVNQVCMFPLSVFRFFLCVYTQSILLLNVHKHKAYSQVFVRQTYQKNARTISTKKAVIEATETHTCAHEGKLRARLRCGRLRCSVWRKRWNPTTTSSSADWGGPEEVRRCQVTYTEREGRLPSSSRLIGTIRVETGPVTAIQRLVGRGAVYLGAMRLLRCHQVGACWRHADAVCLVAF